jgi:DNA-binding protein HU-beta
MNKAQLIDSICGSTGLSKKDANDFLGAFTDAVQGSIANDSPVTLVGFGTFYRTYRKATTGRNPRTNEPIQIKAAYQAKFRAGKAFKAAVN